MDDDPLNVVSVTYLYSINLSASVLSATYNMEGSYIIGQRSATLPFRQRTGKIRTEHTY